MMAYPMLVHAKFWQWGPYRRAEKRRVVNDIIGQSHLGQSDLQELLDDIIDIIEDRDRAQYELLEERGLSRVRRRAEMNQRLAKEAAHTQVAELQRQVDELRAESRASRLAVPVSHWGGGEDGFYTSSLTRWDLAYWEKKGAWWVVTWEMPEKRRVVSNRQGRKGNRGIASEGKREKKKRRGMSAITPAEWAAGGPQLLARIAEIARQNIAEERRLAAELATYDSVSLLQLYREREHFHAEYVKWKEQYHLDSQRIDQLAKTLDIAKSNQVGYVSDSGGVDGPKGTPAHLLICLLVGPQKQTKEVKNENAALRAKLADLEEQLLARSTASGSPASPSCSPAASPPPPSPCPSPSACPPQLAPIEAHKGVQASPVTSDAAVDHEPASLGAMATQTELVSKDQGVATVEVHIRERGVDTRGLLTKATKHARPLNNSGVQVERLVHLCLTCQRRDMNDCHLKAQLKNVRVKSLASALIMVETHIAEFDELFAPSDDLLRTVSELRASIDEAKDDILEYCSLNNDPCPTLKEALHNVKSDGFVVLEARHSDGFVKSALDYFNAFSSACHKARQQLPILITKIKEVEGPATEKAKEFNNSKNITTFDTDNQVCAVWANIFSIKKLLTLAADTLQKAAAGTQELTLEAHAALLRDQDSKEEIKVAIPEGDTQTTTQGSDERRKANAR
ncbi:unnamed protein product [Vitrella brassicaformis CCMP3155]|uniref:Uncharacterized protein n=1 Tax=Vitrella brassicaformis (strain CCMP3155) TaxID=1169540 RepID=A0A0G4GXT6_VITBC|nr:unnamed protein product [Vitrella brassicaformis CCMP3155]|eukprot:CEM35669.1 unnamed protein product [Vitrella brassicaformis CCMP3155]